MQTMANSEKTRFVEIGTQSTHMQSEHNLAYHCYSEADVDYTLYLDDKIPN